MKDLTQGSIAKHVVNMAIPIAIGMFIQTLYYLVDLYFVGELGKNAIAGVSAAGNIAFFILALTQIISVGTVALISQFVGAKEKAKANHVFNKSIFLSLLMLVGTLLVGYGLTDWYMSSISSEQAMIVDGKTYLFWFLPGLAMQFLLASMGSALRGTGIVKPTMIVQVVSVIINIILSPILIAGWLTNYPMGVAGAGLASSISIFIGLILMTRYFFKLECYVKFDWRMMNFKSSINQKIMTIGFPAGGELLLMFLYMVIIYWAIQDVGAEAQAGFGLGSRILQAIFMPALALAFAVPAVVGQNFGANQFNRVKESFNATIKIISVIMLMLSLFCLWEPKILLQPFTNDQDVIFFASNFLQVVALNFLPSGLIFTCSGIFQGLGNTWPALYSVGSRLILFAIPTIWMSQQSLFKIEYIWYLSVVTVLLQSLLSLWLMKREFKKKLITSV